MFIVTGDRLKQLRNIHIVGGDCTRYIWGGPDKHSVLNPARAMFEISLVFAAVRGQKSMGVSNELRVACCLNHRHSQPQWLMVGQLSYHTLKNFPKLAEFPLPAISCRSNLGSGTEDGACTYL